MPNAEPLLLAPFRSEDFDRLINWMSSEEAIIQFAGPIFTYPLTREQLYGYVQKAGRYPYKVIAQNEDLAIGHAEIFLTGDGWAWLCRILIGDERYRRQGLCPPIVETLVEIVYHRFKIHQLALNVYEWNSAAIACYQKAGFVMEADAAKHIQVKGETWKAYRMRLRL